MDYQFQTNGSKLARQECTTKLILGLWEHIDRIWTYRNNKYHENTTQQVARYKLKPYTEDTRKYGRNVARLHDFQTKHFENRQSIGNLNYESKSCWANLADKYITEEV
jgi:hypothetical protein